MGINQFILLLPEDRRADFKLLHTFIHTTVPGLTPLVYNNSLGYGLRHYKYASGREGDCPIVSLVNNKQNISIHVLSVKNGSYLPELYKEKLGKVSVGKGCIRCKQIKDLNFTTLEEVLREAEKLGLAQ